MGRSDDEPGEAEAPVWTPRPVCDDPDCISEAHTTADPRCVSADPPEPIVREIDRDDPKTFFPGLVLHHRDDPGTDFVLKERSPADDGWVFEEDGLGVSDAVFMLSGGLWYVPAAIPLEEQADAEITDIGFDPEDMDPDEIEAMAALMHDSNEVRVSALEEKAGPNQQGSLENAFDALRMLVFLEQIAYKLEVSALANLDFEGRRAKMLTAIESKYAEMLAAQQAAQRAARLAGGTGGPPVGPPPGSGPRPMRRGV
jgi:hypothetical protein